MVLNACINPIQKNTRMITRLFISTYHHIGNIEYKRSQRLFIFGGFFDAEKLKPLGKSQYQLSLRSNDLRMILHKYLEYFKLNL